MEHGPQVQHSLYNLVSPGTPHWTGTMVTNITILVLSIRLDMAVQGRTVVTSMDNGTQCLVQSQPHHLLTGLWASPLTPLCLLPVNGVIIPPVGVW